MYIGISGSRGIMLRNTSLLHDNTVYGYYENDEIIIEKGQYNDIKEIRDQHEKNYKRTDRKYNYSFFILLILMVLICIFSFMYFSFLKAFSILAFCIISYFPMTVIMVAYVGYYQDQNIIHQFRRFHGVEHSVVQLLNDKKDLNLENVKKASLYDNECGTVHSLEIIFLAGVICFFIQHLFIWGIFKCLLIFVGVVIVMFVNVFNPYNPFQYIQMIAVEKPTDREYLLALSVADCLKNQEDSESTYQ